MEVIHSLGSLSINKSVNENVGFLLTNKKGSYCSFFNAPASRYHGLFYFDEKSMDIHKFVESIEMTGNNDVSNLKNGFYFAERRKGDVVESFRMPKNFNSLIYELSRENDINLILDCKGSYDDREWGRYYDISKEKNCVIVKFTKRTNRKEDSSDGAEEFVLYRVVKSNNNFYEKNDRWFERHYSYDEERNSPPFNRHIYNALRLKGSKFVFSMSKNKDNAIKECEHIFNDLDAIKTKEKENFFNILKNDAMKKIIKNDKIKQEIKVAYINTFNSLNNLIIDNKNDYGLLAGLPWFFQFWSRDTLVSLKALSKINKNLEEKMLYNYLNNINDDGRLSNLARRHFSKNLGSADAHGWLFLRCNDIIKKINKDKEITNSIKKSIGIIKNNKNSDSARTKEYLKKCNLLINKKENAYHKIIYEVESSLEKSINGLLKFHTKDSFEFNEAKETWMDTDFGGDCRKGARIEIQALRLNVYRLMFELTQNNKYRILENTLKIRLKQKFWNGQILADGLDDFTIRPNIFIAAYAYPDLLTGKEWEICFENVLEKLWLDWGGLSTIDKNNPLYTDAYTGEQNIKSYHRGDSWFWVNNLSALILNKINKLKFNKNIKKIIDASTEEILWKGCIGCHAELSSAKELQSKGCFNQAWSNAMYIELIEELFQ